MSLYQLAASTLQVDSFNVQFNLTTIAIHYTGSNNLFELHVTEKGQGYMNLIIEIAVHNINTSTTIIFVLIEI